MRDRTYSHAAYEPTPHLEGGLRPRAEGATMPITGANPGSDAKRVRTHHPAHFGSRV
jgi:hypothetical protein